MTIDFQCKPGSILDDPNFFTAVGFQNAQSAFEQLYKLISQEGIDTGNGTRTLFNIGFYIVDPSDNHIYTPWRKWSQTYAEREWNWYVSGDRSVKEIAKYAPIWDRMHGGDGIVNSNYGHLWMQNGQLEKTIKQLRDDSKTRQAWITLFDGKNKDEYQYDTPCTLGVGFNIVNGKLNMNVVMRSNDIWFGFCNDQYCFSRLQEIVANEVGCDVGWYHHFVTNLHLYHAQANKNNTHENIRCKV